MKNVILVLLGGLIMFLLGVTVSTNLSTVSMIIGTLLAAVVD